MSDDPALAAHESTGWVPLGPLHGDVAMHQAMDDGDNHEYDVDLSRDDAPMGVSVVAPKADSGVAELTAIDPDNAERERDLQCEFDMFEEMQRAEALRCVPAVDDGDENPDFDVDLDAELGSSSWGLLGAGRSSVLATAQGDDAAMVDLTGGCPDHAGVSGEASDDGGVPVSEGNAVAL